MTPAPLAVAEAEAAFRAWLADYDGSTLGEMPADTIAEFQDGIAAHAGCWIAAHETDGVEVPATALGKLLDLYGEVASVAAATLTRSLADGETDPIDPLDEE